MTKRSRFGPGPSREAVKAAIHRLGIEHRQLAKDRRRNGELTKRMYAIHRRMCGVTADLVWVGPKVEHLRKPPMSAEIDRMMDLSARLTARA